jgi:hypothetical protein
MLRKVIFVLVVLILCTPLYRSIEKFFFGTEFDSILVGAFVVPNRPVLSIKNIINGTFQNDFEVYFSYNMVGRQTMTRTYNQILYSLFNSVSSSEFNLGTFIGKNKYLFEFIYPNAYLNEPDDDEKDELFDNLTLLTLLQQKIEEMGKKLTVIVTPSKASFYAEYLPDSYAPYISMKDRGEYSQNYYEYFVSRTRETGLRYFDFHDEFLELKNNGTDIFTKGGVHWTGPATAAYITGLINALNENTEKKIGTIQTIRAEPIWGNAFINDNDLERLLNLINFTGAVQKILPFYQYLFPRAQFYSYHMESLSVPTDYRPSVFVCGGSFNYMWLWMVYGLNGWATLGDSPILGSAEFSYYNSFVIKFPEYIRIADATDDFYSVLEKDIIIIELNEQAIAPDASQFVFAKNLLTFIEKGRN